MPKRMLLSLSCHPVVRIQASFHLDNQQLLLLVPSFSNQDPRCSSVLPKCCCLLQGPRGRTAGCQSTMPSCWPCACRAVWRAWRSGQSSAEDPTGVLSSCWCTCQLESYQEADGSLRVSPVCDCANLPLKGIRLYCQAWRRCLQDLRAEKAAPMCRCVYKGKWRGVLVAIKIVEAPLDNYSADAARESLLSASISHPNVVVGFDLSRVSCYCGCCTGQHKRIKLWNSFHCRWDLMTCIVSSPAGLLQDLCSAHRRRGLIRDRERHSFRYRHGAGGW